VLLANVFISGVQADRKVIGVETKAEDPSEVWRSEALKG